MKIDLSEATFIIPIRIESQDRLRNVITTTAFLLENFDTNIIIKEVDFESVFEKDALPVLEDILDCDIDVKHVFEKSEEPLFHRQKVLNEMIVQVHHHNQRILVLIYVIIINNLDFQFEAQRKLLYSVKQLMMILYLLHLILKYPYHKLLNQL